MELSKQHGPHQGAALMKRSTKYVALDVHQATTVRSVRDMSGRVIARSILPTEAAALVEYFRGMRGAIHVAFEEGAQAQWLHDVLTPVVDRVIVCDRRGERRGNKADQPDADRLSHRLLNGDLRAVYHGSADRITLKGAHAHVHECSRGCGPRDAPAQIALSCSRSARSRQARVWVKTAGRMSRGSHQGAALIKRTTKYVALDVHQATTVAAVREQSG